MSRTIVITGANRGIGFAMAKQCQQAGDNVYALCPGCGVDAVIASDAEDTVSKAMLLAMHKYYFLSK